MLVKSADDKSGRITMLTELQNSTGLDGRQRAWVAEELMRLRRGIEGERAAAHYIDNYFKDGVNTAVLHDLRIVVDGDVAQIDHLIVHRMFNFFLLETKCFGGNVEINERGEFSVSYRGERRFGIPSPIEQSRRHERILARLLKQIGIVGRAGLAPKFHHAALFHPKAVITRPRSEQFNTDDVIKADHIGTWYQARIDRSGTVTGALTDLLNLRSSDTTREWAEKIARQHRPQDPLLLPEFMQRRAPQRPPPPPAAPRPLPPAPPVLATPAREHAPAQRKLVCASCGIKITYPEGKFCWNNEARFGGLQYCREHQQQFSRQPQ